MHLRSPGTNTYYFSPYIPAARLAPHWSGCSSVPSGLSPSSNRYVLVGGEQVSLARVPPLCRPVIGVLVYATIPSPVPAMFGGLFCAFLNAPEAHYYPRSDLVLLRPV